MSASELRKRLAKEERMDFSLAEALKNLVCSGFQELGFRFIIMFFCLRGGGGRGALPPLFVPQILILQISFHCRLGKAQYPALKHKPPVPRWHWGWVWEGGVGGKRGSGLNPKP